MGNPFVNSADGGACIDCEHCTGFRTDDQGTRALCRKVVGGDFWKYLTGCRYWIARSAVSPQDGPENEDRST
jgi:hypothetical protein